MSQPKNLMSEVVLTDAQREHVRAFAKKFGGDHSLLNVLNQTCVAMSLDIFQYFNRLENEKKDCLNYPQRREIRYASAGIEQNLGALIAYAEMVRVLLEDKYPESDFDVNSAIQRWFDHAEYHFENPAEEILK